ncbi:DsrE family protein [Qaidamihabitans albus]|uniref:DsrE family protein n=1 Tax=Qaidamihabitans albus TaxID=2795733 RepID=UPI0018F22CCC|nr:DsrE family protein [Qaidamihabitans albus]
MSGTLFILNDTPYGTERTYNGLRLAAALTKRGNNDVRVLLVGDAVAAAMAGQKLPDGYYHLDRILAPAPATAPTSPAAVPAWTHVASPRTC